ncbi:unnamed protein product [Phytophthora fragariaefolia]|uniref:Unnamed protein product n=1 Tax=Phytophthora fragariaefolia TaxID=1490495 RepID=A0A9W7CW45_9STRA|nr:unnamed protein product [Phytophthora fragariaefolia]
MLQQPRWPTRNVHPKNCPGEAPGNESGSKEASNSGRQAWTQAAPNPAKVRQALYDTRLDYRLTCTMLVSWSDSAGSDGDAAPTTPQAARGEVFTDLSPHDLSCNNDKDESNSGDDSSRTSLHGMTLKAGANVKYSTLDADGENEEGTGWGDDELTGDCEPCVNLDEDGPAQPELRYDPAIMFGPELLEAAGGADQLAGGNVPKELLKTIVSRGWKPLIQQTPCDYLMEPYEPRPADSMQTDYPRLEKIEERIAGQHAKQEARKMKHPDFKPKTQDQIREELQKTEDITARDLCVFIGLLIARCMAPNKEKLENHWKTTDEGAIPRGCFGQFLVWDHFMHTSRNLHFSSNTDGRAKVDRAWKIRPVITALQTRFQLGYTPPPTMAFDEAMLPSQSSFNRMRVFMKDKPHRWGTKLFMVRRSTMAYCIRFEVYSGKQERPDATGTLTDYKSGPAAVIRNLKEVFGPDGPGLEAIRLFVTERFYTSVALAIQMLMNGYYSIGTVQTDRLGLPVSLVGEKLKKGEKKKKPPKNRPASIERGTFEVADLITVPRYRALRWWDNKAVYMLASGGSVELDRVRSP